MRLIHVVPAITEEASGPSYSAVRLCDSLLAGGDSLKLVALDWAELKSQPDYLRTFPLSPGPSRLGRSSTMARWLVEQCTRHRVDVLHNHGMWQFNSLYPARATRGTSVKLVQSPRGAFSKWAMGHGSKAKRWFWPLLQRPALEQVDCFHATAESEYEDVRRLGFRQPVAIIPNGIDLPARLGRNHGSQNVVLFLSRIHKKKGLDHLLHAWRPLESQFPEWRLDIVGDDKGYDSGGRYLDELKVLSSSLRLQRATFVGPRFGDEKWATYASADLFVLPTHSENFGLVVAEALASGTPAIVSKGAPWPDLEANGAGWWVDIGVEPLANALRAALSMDRATLAQMGERGRVWMEREFGWVEIARRMQVTYQWLIDRSLPVPPWVRTD